MMVIVSTIVWTTLQIGLGVGIHAFLVWGGMQIGLYEFLTWFLAMLLFKKTYDFYMFLHQYLTDPDEVEKKLRSIRNSLMNLKK